MGGLNSAKCLYACSVELHFVLSSPFLLVSLDIEKGTLHFPSRCGARRIEFPEGKFPRIELRIKSSCGRVGALKSLSNGRSKISRYDGNSVVVALLPGCR